MAGGWGPSYETRRLVRRTVGGAMVLAGLLVTLRYLPAWLWLVAAGALTAWMGVLLLRDR